MIPIGTHVFIEPVQQDETSSGLIRMEERHPTSGWLYAVGHGCQEDLSVGDFVVLEEHGFTHDDVRQDTFFILLEDGEGVHVVRADVDVEPVIRQQWESYKRTKEDTIIRCYDIDRSNEAVRFNASDINDLQLGLFTQTGYTLSYRHHAMLEPHHTGLSHKLMVVPEREILFSIPRNLLDDAEDQG